jgi:hypothetical protein
MRNTPPGESTNIVFVGIRTMLLTNVLTAEMEFAVYPHVFTTPRAATSLSRYAVICRGRRGSSRSTRYRW